MDEPLSESVAGPADKVARPNAATQQRMAQGLDVATSIIRQAASVVGDISDNLGAVLAAAAVNFGKADGKELVVDIEALVSSLLTVRLKGRIKTAADVVQEWARTQTLDFTLRASPVTGGLAPTLSRSVMNQVLPRAIAVRDRTMGGNLEPVGLRHLLLALAERQPAQWPPLADGGHPSGQSLAALRALIVERTGRTPKRGEDMAAWRQLLSERAPAGDDPKPPAAERTPLLSDNPAAVDELGRKPLADALAARLVRLQKAEAASADPKAVMVHLHGPWGSGKSSLVRFLSGTLGRESPRWLVVEFNAWRNARVKPPWWYMLTEWKRLLARRLLADVKLLHWAWLQLRWAWVSPSVDNVVLVAGGLLVLALFVLFGDNASQIKEALKGGPELLTLVTGTIAGLVAGGRALLLGSKQAAETFDALRTDSYRPFVRLYTMLVKSSPCPVLIVLDDLDRCDQQTVTDLLEGIQTLFRSQPVVFLAVADRHWITASFAERFELFDKGGDKARPVGDLFLDKMFQVSVSIPALPVAVKRAYLGRLVGIETAPTVTARLPDTALRHEEIQAAIAEAPEEQRPALRAQAVARLATVQADKAVEHKLLRWASYIEPNPRGMKRLVNAIGMMQARTLLEGRSVDFDAIVLWTILDLRWPRAAAAITADPGLIDRDGEGPDPLLAAWADPMFQRIAHELDEEQVRALIGAPEDEEDRA